MGDQPDYERRDEGIGSYTPSSDDSNDALAHSHDNQAHSIAFARQPFESSLVVFVLLVVIFFVLFDCFFEFRGDDDTAFSRCLLVDECFIVVART